MLAGERPWSELSAAVARIFNRISESRRITITAVRGWRVGRPDEVAALARFCAPTPPVTSPGRWWASRVASTCREAASRFGGGQDARAL